MSRNRYKPAAALISAIRGVMWVVLIIVWAVIGFFLWIPLMTRCVGFFSFNLSVSVFKPSTSLERGEKALHSSIEFYSDGFNRISKSIWNPPLTRGRVDELGMVHIWMLLKEVCWATLIWCIWGWVSGIVSVEPIFEWAKSLRKWFQPF